MELIETLTVKRKVGGLPSATVELLSGDLSALPRAHAVDALVVSAFPNSYTPNPGTLFASLLKRGLDMREVARNKAEDERLHLGCWISEPIAAELARSLHFKRVICFEPAHPTFLANSGIDSAKIEDAVGFVFRCLNNFIIPHDQSRRRYDISTVAMPLLATGNQAIPLDAILPRLLDAAIFWLEHGLPIRRLSVVAYGTVSARTAAAVFARAKARLALRPHAASTRGVDVVAPLDSSAFIDALGSHVLEMCREHLNDELRSVARPAERPTVDRILKRAARVQRPPSDARPGGAAMGPPHIAAQSYDVFLSYAHKQDREIEVLIGALEKLRPQPRVFFDRTAIPPGGQWLRVISDAVASARIFVAVLSPAYSASPVCWDEFQCAKLMEYTTAKSLIRTIRLYREAVLPPLMGVHSYIDCVEGDLKRLSAAAAKVMAS